MRIPCGCTGIVTSAVLLCLCSALQAAPETTKVQSERSAPSESGATGVASEPEALSSERDRDLSRSWSRPSDRRWSIAASFETHAAIVRDEPSANVGEDGRSRPTKLYDYLLVSPALQLSPRDQIRAYLGAYQRFLADDGESGFRLSDWILAYSRFLPIATEAGLPPSIVPLRGVLLRVEASVSAPTSYRSQLRSIITVPRLRVFADKAFANRRLIVGVNAFGERYFARYRSAEGGSPNPYERAAVEATVDYSMPFLRPLSIGVLADTSYSWYYNVASAGPLPYGNAGDPQFSSQPMQQRYGAEVRARYALPAWHDVLGVLAVAYSVGDNTVLHDGVQHLYYTFYRRASEVYATLSARY